MADRAERLAREIHSKRTTKNVVHTKLLTDERVIARVTDGIYRQPASALRELISNAYDADATEVFIDTDAPRFQRITISDNGRGMTPEVLAHLLCHIGGSAKRTRVGPSIGIASPRDPKKSPGGRPLIGKIGIGLFSVAQLTQSFQILTKVKGDDFRTVAAIVLKTYTEDDLGDRSASTEFESGLVSIWSERAEDVKAQGTTVILTDVRPQARDTLRSSGIWAAIEEARREIGEQQKDVSPPTYHVGRVDLQSGDTVEDTANTPWVKEDTPEQKFRSQVQRVWDQVGEGNLNPKLDSVFDYYLRMIWNLGLAAPLPYVGEHPFDIKFKKSVPIYKLSNSPKGSAEQVRVGLNKSARDALDLMDVIATNFRVVVDGVALQRPLKFVDLPTTSHALKHPILFIGSCDERFEDVPKEFSGGLLSFEAYLLWTPKVAPREHRGVLVRINGSSGTLFDETFMRYQISELTRLSQITCEIFVKDGLDGALNIDRESFNFAHPHYVFLSRWLHNALRQLATTQKRVAAAVREESREQEEKGAAGRLRALVNREWVAAGADTSHRPPLVSFAPRSEVSKKSPADIREFTYDRDVVLKPISKGGRANKSLKTTELKLKAIAQILSAYELLDDMPKAKQERLLRAIGEVLNLDMSA